MVYTLVLEANAERIESSSLSLPTKQDSIILKNAVTRIDE